MRLALFTAFIASLAFSQPVSAGERVTLGIGRLFSNDHFGDNEDRWRTGSLQFSFLRGTEGTTARPAGLGEVIEYRFASATVAPSNLTNPNPADRRYAGMLTFGAHSHFSASAFDFSLGADLVVIGPQTGTGHFQTLIHEAFNMVPPSAVALANQIPNAVYPTALVEMARPVSLGSRLTLRPFAEAQAGIESFARVGADLLWGGAWDQGIFVRDSTTGQLYQATRSEPTPGLSFLIGGDVAYVFGTELLPTSDGYQLTPTRNRARLGLHLQGERAAVFYGLTWMGREFEAQPEGQLLGSIRLDVKF
ncbi:MAG: lipid A deacylase LpxR family protein [Rhodobacteraceae bacterium]|nr:lipid A deacylase LpxR family protein [Paracoccaceae bacterium]